MNVKNQNIRQLPKFLLSDFAYKYEIENDICLYHSLLIKKIFLKKEEYRKLKNFLKTGIVKDEELIKKLYNDGFLINRKEDKAVYKKAQELVKNWGLKTLFLVVTDKCNFKCKYCFENLEKYSKQKIMDKETAKKAMKMFAQKTGKSDYPKTIFFYGGEPLLNFNVVKFAVEYANKLKKRGEIKEPCSLDIITNGSLINKKVIELAKKYNISFGVSLDGFEYTHNRMRVYDKNVGTFKDVVNGINLLRKNSIDHSILCTIGPHNIGKLDKICEFFIRELGAKNINLTLPLCKIGRGYPFSKEIPVDYLLKQIIKASKVIRKYGSYEGTYFKHLISFVEEEIFRGECDGMGCQIVVSPDGKIGPCLAFINEKNFFIKDDFSNFNIKNKQIFRKFAKGIALLMPECKKCPALGICGGGCIYNRFVKGGKIGKQDPYFCDFVKGLLKHFIIELDKEIIKDD